MSWRVAEKRTSLDRVGLDKGKNEFEMDRRTNSLRKVEYE
jgi:hypothetical protein